MSRAVVLFCAVLALVKGETTQVSQCISNAGPLPLNVHVEGCVTPPCHLPQLQDAIVSIIFKAPHTMPEMTTLATAYMSVGLITLPIPYSLGEQSVTCNFLANTYCPVVQDEVVQYTLNMFIDSFMPVGTQVTVEFRIVDHNNFAVVCVRVPLQIIPPVVSKLGAQNATILL